MNTKEDEKGIKKNDSKEIQETGVDAVITRAMTFADCIGVIHYCRLSYKLSCLL